jgi:Tfp pilus assembly protein PilF
MKTPTAIPGPASSRGRPVAFAAVSLLLLTIILYSNTLHIPWHFDDLRNILHNQAIHLDELSWDKIKRTFYAGPGGPEKLYRPVACFSFALNYYFGRDQVFGYHVVNLLVHYLTALFLFLFLYNTLRLPSLSTRYRNNAYAIALLGSVLWAINPVQIQAVTYIVQRMAGMAAMFYIMAMFFFLKGRTSGTTPGKGVSYFLFLVCALLAFGSKENAAMLPIIVLLFDLYMIQRLRAETLKRNLLFFLLLLAVPFLIALLLQHAAPFSLDKLLAGYQIRSFNLFERLLTESRVIIYYISLLLYPMPQRLSIVHDVAVSQSLFDPPTTLVALLALVSILSFTLLNSKKRPLICFCSLFFFINHIIESSIFPLELIFEHRNYLPSLMFFVPVSICILRLFQFISSKQTLRLITYGTFILVLIGLGHSTYIRNHTWRSGISLWLDAAKKNPASPRAFHNLGRYYVLNHQTDKALAAYHRAIGLSRGTHSETRHQTHNAMAVIYLQNGQTEKALKHSLKALEIRPRFYKAWINLGAVYMKMGRYDEALEFFAKVLDNDKGTVKVYNNLGHIYIKKGMIEKAVIQFRQALSLQPGFESALRGLGICHKIRGDYPQSKRFLEMALSVNPRRIMTRLHLIETLHLMNAPEQARMLARETKDIIPKTKLQKVIRSIRNKEENPYEKMPGGEVIFRYIGSPLL